MGFESSRQSAQRKQFDERAPTATATKNKDLTQNVRLACAVCNFSLHRSQNLVNSRVGGEDQVSGSLHFIFSTQVTSGSIWR